jgi:polysaccharide chain length determinant protein (PEP-CTERM system associated)
MQSLRILLRRELIAAWRYRWMALAFSWVICLGGWAYTSFIPNQYEASARLYVDADAVLTPLLRGIAVDSALASQIDVLQRTLLSRPNLEKLVSKTDLDLSISGPNDLEAMVQALAQAIKIVPVTRNLFTITYRNTSPKLAYDVVQAILTQFVENKTGNNRSEMENAQTFLQQQIDSYERQLRTAERKRAEFRTKYIDLLPSDANGGISGVEAARGNVRALQGQLQDTILARDTITKELATTPQMVVTETDSGGGGGGGGGPSPELAQAERALSDLRLRYTEQHPDVIAAKALVASLRAGGGVSSGGGGGASRPSAPRTRSAPNPVYEQLKVRLVETDGAVASLQRRLAEAIKDRDRLDDIARGAPGLQAEASNLNRDYDVLRKNYEELISRREAMRIAVAAEADADKIKMQIIDPPQVPRIPVAPKRSLLISGVLVAGIAGGLGLALLLVQFDRSFHTIDDLRELGLPVIGGISLLTVSAARTRVTALFTFGIAVLLLAALYGGLLYRFIMPTGYI